MKPPQEIFHTTQRSDETMTARHVSEPFSSCVRLAGNTAFPLRKPTRVARRSQCLLGLIKRTLTVREQALCASRAGAARAGGDLFLLPLTRMLKRSTVCLEGVQVSGSRCLVGRASGGIWSLTNVLVEKYFKPKRVNLHTSRISREIGRGNQPVSTSSGRS